jgi:outer membrane protein OmpA-like peptidoglycan-associated protein
MVMGSAGAPLGWISALLMALSACAGPLEAYRSARGIDKNDPDPATSTFTANLAAADAAPYPNLATVPEPPTQASTATEREALTRTLITERTNLQQAAGVSPNAAAPSSPRQTAATVLPDPAAMPTPAPPPPQLGQPSAAFVTATSSPPPAPVPAAAMPSAAPPPPVLGEATPPGRRRAAEPPPLNSTLQSPEVRSSPEPEESRPPPAPPQVAGGPVARGSAPSRSLMAAGTPSPAPAVPSLDPPPPPGAGPASRRPAVGVTLAAMNLPAGGGELGPAERARLNEVAAQYREKPGALRVVAHAAPAAGSAEQLNAYRAALERAQAVARALAEAGVPANKIQTEAAPAGTAGGRVEIQLLP